MKKVKTKNIFWVIMVILPVFLNASEYQIKLIKSPEDLPEKFCSLWKEGDLQISDGKILLLLCGSERVLHSYYKYLIEHTMGSILTAVSFARS